ncbi:MAG: hypothetical protein V1810_03410 [Candidatus Beckwithbacteria bacterium]
MGKLSMKELKVEYQFSLDEDKGKDALDEVFDRIFSKVWTTYSGEDITTTSGLMSVGTYINDNHSCPDTLVSSPNERGHTFIDQGDYDISLTYSNSEIGPWNLFIN